MKRDLWGRTLARALAQHGVELVFGTHGTHGTYSLESMPDSKTNGSATVSPPSQQDWTQP